MSPTALRIASTIGAVMLVVGIWLLAIMAADPADEPFWQTCSAAFLIIVGSRLNCATLTRAES